MTAYAYLRKSSIYGSSDPEAAAQEHAVTELASRFGDAPLTVLSDMDISGMGKYTARRKAYQELLAAVESGKAAAVYSYSLSRLARSVAEISRFLDLCAARNVPVRLVADSIDTSTASGRMTANVLASVAQFEAEVTGERVKARIAVKQANGEPVGAPPYGARHGEDLSAVLNAFYEAGSYRGAARLLNKQGTAKPRYAKSGLWTSSSIRAIVLKHDPSIRPPQRGARIRGSFRLSRLLLCGTCGTALTGTRQIDKRKPDAPVVRIVYECYRGHDIPHPKRSIHEPAILPAIKAEASRYVPPTLEELRGNEERRAALEGERMRVLDMYQSGDITKAEQAQRLLGIRNKSARLGVAHRIDWFVPPLAESDFDRYSPKAMNRVLRALWSGVRLDPRTYQPVGFEGNPNRDPEYALAESDAEREAVAQELRESRN